MSSSKKRKISSKTLKEKYEAIKKLESGCANKNVAADYDVFPSTLSTWLKSKDKIVKAFEGGTSSKTQKLKPCGNENLERALYTWFVQMRRQGVPVSGPVLREKALSYAQTIAINDLDNPFAVLSEEIQSLREAYPEAVPASVNADDVIGIDDAVSTSESGSLTDEKILAEFSSDQEAMEEEEETDEVEVLEECPKKPTASEVRSAIDVLTSYSLFVNEGVEEIRSHVQKIEALAERNFRSSQRQQTLLSFFGSKMQSPLNNKDQ